MSNITDYSFSFSLVRNYIIFNFKRYYGNYIVTGRENIPLNCPVIFAPNHINALMDALAVHSIAPPKLPVIFLARADVFKNPTAKKLLKFCKIMPAFRMRDGIENLGKNNDVFEHCVGILRQNKALGIMPEGDQGEQRKLRPLVKGIFRIAFAAQQLQGALPYVKIVPVGIDYGDLTKFGKHIIINIGKPIEVSAFMSAHQQNPVIATNEIRDILRNNLNDLSVNLASVKYYECFEIVIKVANSTFVKKLNLIENTVNRFTARQEIVKKLVELEENEPDKIEKLNSIAIKLKGLMNKLNLQKWVLETENQTKTRIISKSLLLLCTFPIFIAGLLFNFLPFFLPVFIRKFVLKSQYEGFFSSLQFGLGILTFPLLYLLQTIFFGVCIHTTWWLIVIFILLQYPLGKLAIKWNKHAKKSWAKLRFHMLTQKKSSDLLQAQKMQEQIIRMISL